MNIFSEFVHQKNRKNIKIRSGKAVKTWNSHNRSGKRKWGNTREKTKTKFESKKSLMVKFSF